MKRALLLLIAVSALTIRGLAQTYTWYFGGNMHEYSGTGPNLTAACTGGYTSETLPIGVTRNVFHFDKGCGITFDDSVGGFLSAGSYTIEMYVRLDTIQGYKKLIDFKNRTSDKGLYNQNGRLVLYSLTSTADSLIPDSQYVYVALTRDASTKKLIGYVNSRVDTVWTDPDTDYVYNNHKKLIFLQDDAGTGGEQTSGTVSMIRITNSAIDSNTMKTKFAHLAVPVIVGTRENVRIYPNPAADNIHVMVDNDFTYTLCDLTGRLMQQGKLKRGDNNITMSGLYTGLYLLKLTDANGTTQVHKLTKQ